MERLHLAETRQLARKAFTALSTMSTILQKTTRHFQTRVLKPLFCSRQRQSTKRRAIVRAGKVGETQARHLRRSTFKELGERFNRSPFLLP
nr:MAG TPA: hypothetical protein [Caudoviricetes sp.]